MNNTAHAGGEIFPQPVFWQSYNQYAFYPDQNQACLAEAQRESAYQGWTFISVDTCALSPTDPNYLLGTFSFNAKNVTQIQQTRMVAGVARVTCSAHSSPSASSNITCGCSDGYFPDLSKTSCVPCLPPDVLNQQTGKCEPPDTYVLSLSPDAATIEPGKSFQFKAVVTKQGGGAPSKSVPVSVKVEVDPTSGGHEHGETFATRPKGSVSPSSGSTVLPFTFTATDVSGTHTITARCDLCVNKTETAKVTVKVDGLNTITAAPTLYAFVGGEAGKTHHDNHNLTSNAFYQLVVLAINYHFLYPNDPVLHLNDASLRWGGKFDIKGNWTGDHQGHKRGTVIDIRANTESGNIPERSFTAFEELADGTQKDLAGKIVSANAELHCSTGRDPAVDNCVGDGNRHYHVILLGVDQ